MADAQVWGEGGRDQQLKAAFKEFVSWAKVHKIQHSQPSFSTTSPGYPSFHCKAYNGRVVLAWMAGKAVQNVNSYQDEQLATALQSGCNIASLTCYKGYLQVGARTENIPTANPALIITPGGTLPTGSIFASAPRSS
ncbi:unnamed protein product [Symbiodinium sp. CCMP2592]|nr:unnamed protein product [Symbiodinium sp. CCMP2592]